MFDYWRTPYLAVGLALVIGTATIALVEAPARPLTPVQRSIFYLLSYLPGLGLAMLGDPAARRAKARYLKIDFYAPKDGVAARDGWVVPEGGIADPAGTHQGKGE